MDQGVRFTPSKDPWFDLFNNDGTDDSFVMPPIPMTRDFYGEYLRLAYYEQMLKRMSGPDGAPQNSGSEASPKTYTVSDVAGLIKPTDDLSRLVGPGKAFASQEEFVGYVVDRCNKYSQECHVDLNPAIVLALIKRESGFNPNAVSSCGAKGLSQLMDGTARDVGVTNPFDPKQNLDGCIKYLGQRLARWNGNVQKALIAYNRGDGRVQESLNNPGGAPAGHGLVYAQAIMRDAETRGTG